MMRAAVKLDGEAQEKLRVRVQNLQQVDVRVTVVMEEEQDGEERAGGLTTSQSSTPITTIPTPTTRTRCGVVVGFESDSLRYLVQIIPNTSRDGSNSHNARDDSDNNENNNDESGRGAGETMAVEVGRVLFERGTKVRVQGVEGHDNKVGVIESYDATNLRYSVRFQDNAAISVKADKLRL
eukprot:c20378_g1_i1.p1 GENE.c20378_g1_i1~~c20378_g1_i1.p1  ORF type:complete len:201 (-),score=53.54 c20378_g1_i1:147-689(-)